MRFRLTDDQRALKQGVRDVLARLFGPGELRAAADAVGPPRLDRTRWRALGEAGLFALCLPERAGGIGLGLPEAVLAFEEVGRSLLPGPTVATHLAAATVPGAATGETVVTSVDGDLVEWLEESDVIHGDTTGATPLRSMDPLTPLHRRYVAAGSRAAGAARVGAAAPLQRGQATPPPPSTDTAAPHTDGTGTTSPRVADLLTAAEQLGTALRVCELAVQHARTREQFGTPIGAFQAVKHLCADMLVRAETARAAVYAAALTATPEDIAAARLLADEAAVRGARDCLQVHGGMGFTWEADVHLHLKRAWVRAARGGGSAEHEELLAADLLT
ncbi:acyl-CoA dehydrogenase family protein [Streptomyces sp. L2]|uniref:acyl-CoA dehydrogenase family protein n=1 Tax=Streptomyces sp. L2 TaxID=2162665 RepID=UPI0010130103|nr:acyl-CoA dehydrogenase family protein [Streptomyces sp. L2]